MQFITNLSFFCLPIKAPVRMRAQSPSKPAAKKAKASPKKKTPAKKQTKKVSRFVNFDCI